MRKKRSSVDHGRLESSTPLAPAIEGQSDSNRLEERDHAQDGGVNQQQQHHHDETVDVMEDAEEDMVIY